MDDSWDTPSEEEEVIYGTTPPYSARQIKRMHGKNQKAGQSRSAGRSPNKGNVISVFVKAFYGNYACMVLTLSL